MTALLLLVLAGCPPKQPPPPPPTGTTTTPVTTPVTTPTTSTAPVTAPDAAPAAPPKPDRLAPPVKAALQDVAPLLSTPNANNAMAALEKLKPLTSQYPDIPEIHYNIGLAYFLLGQETEARREWLRATEVDPTYANAWINLGGLSARAGEYDRALMNYQTGTRYAPTNIDLRVATVGALRELKRYDDAVREAKTALTINSKALNIYINLALVYVDTNQLDLARFSLEKAKIDIEKADESALLHATLGQVYYQLGYTPDAVAEFKRALELDGNQLVAMLFLSNYHLDNRNYQDALTLLERANVLTPNDPGIILNMGVAYRGLGRLEEAKAAYEKALQLDPKNPEPYRNLAVLYGDYMKAYDAAVQAIEDYRKAGGGKANPKELDDWIASIRKEQERVKKEADRKKKKEEDAARKAAEEAAEAAKAAEDAKAAEAAKAAEEAAKAQATPQPSPEPSPLQPPQPQPQPQPQPTDPNAPWGGDPAPAPAPAPSDPQPAPAPAPSEPQPAPGDNPWGTGGG